MSSGVARFYDEFRAHYGQQNFGAAADSFACALRVAPGTAFRYFMAHASAELTTAIRLAHRAEELGDLLDGLLSDHPDMHLLADGDTAEIERLIALREANIAKGLPSVAVVTQGKTASIPVANIFNSGFNLPSYAYSLASLVVIESFAHDFARGGACYSTHLNPTPTNVRRLKAAGIEKIIVHVRDPRQSLLSMIHHVARYPEQRPELARVGFQERSIADQIYDMMGFFFSGVSWIQGWMDAEAELNILFSTFQDFVRDNVAFTRRYLGFYGHEEHFSWHNARNAGGDQHFRLGRVDEWREVFPKASAEFLTAIIPGTIFERFGWSP